MLSPSAAVEAVRRLGLRPLAHYASYQLKLRSGWLRVRTPAGKWTGQLPMAYRHAARPDAFPMPVDHVLQERLVSLPGSSRDQAVRVAEDILAGRFELFGREPVKLGMPPSWGRFVPLGDTPSPLTVGSDRHWSSYRLDALGGDVKLIWEPSRFGWVYGLGRAFTWTGDARFASGFSSLLASWLHSNPPNLGPQWISGQEVAMRLMALIFAWRAFGSWLDGRESQRAALAEVMAVHGRRLPPTLNYAQAQDNNHLLVEAAALAVTGMCFPGWPEAARWRSLGRGLLAGAAARQFYPDGGYVQHSVNYARLALETLLWTAVAGQRAGEPLPEAALAALDRGADWLEAMTLGAAGRAPNFGPNDGAYLLPLTACDYEDFRPTLDAIRRFRGRSRLPLGAWSELGHWLGLPVGTDSEAARPSTALADRRLAGQYFQGSGRLRTVMRCARFDRRPGHADQLHLDVWYDGQAVTLDPGTYLYNAPAQWDNALAGEDVHNLPMIDGQAAMTRAGRFLWLAWAQAEFLGRWGSAGSQLEVVAAAHTGYRREGIRIQRSLLRVGDAALVVVDEAFGPGEHRLTAGWNLSNTEWKPEGRRMILENERGPSLVEFAEPASEPRVYIGGKPYYGEFEGEQPTWGWVSPTYAVRQPCLRAVAEVRGTLPLRLVTWFVWEPAARDALDLDWTAPRAGRPPWSQIRWGPERLSL